MITLLRTLFAILINEPAVISNEPVLFPLWGHWHQITFRIDRPNLHFEPKLAGHNILCPASFIAELSDSQFYPLPRLFY
jgi:hypothetical protein